MKYQMFLKIFGVEIVSKNVNFGIDFDYNNVLVHCKQDGSRYN